MLSSLFLILVFVLAIRWFGPQSALTTAAGIPCIVIAGLFAMAFFEPTAQRAHVSTGLIALLRPEADFIFFTVLFVGALTAQLGLLAQFPKPPRLPDPLEYRACLALSIVASYLVTSITLTACDTSPRIQKLLGLGPDRAALFGFISPDSQWLSLVSLMSNGALSRPQLVVVDPTSDEPPETEVFGDHPQTLRQRFVE